MRLGAYSPKGLGPGERPCELYNKNGKKQGKGKDKPLTVFAVLPMASFFTDSYNFGDKSDQIICSRSQGPIKGRHKIAEASAECGEKVTHRKETLQKERVVIG